MITLRSLLIAVFAVSVIGTAKAALDLTPTPEEYVSSGIVYKRLVFRDSARRVEMEFPPNWNFRVVSSARLELTPPGNGFARALIQTQPATAGIVDERTLKALAEESLAALPPGTQGGTVERIYTNPDGSGAGGEGEVILTYKSLGYTFRRSIRLMSFPDCRLLAQVTAPEAEFQAVNVPFRRAVQSLSWN